MSSGIVLKRRGACVPAALLLLAGPAHGQLSTGTSFVGSDFATSGFIPPDTMGAVGPDHFVELINGEYAVYQKSDGSQLDDSTLNQFWQAAGVSPTGSSFDPRLLYDHDSGRWFAVAVDNAQGPNNFLVAVSETGDPMDGWTGFKIDADTDNLQWADFPTVGLNQDGLYVAANMFGLGGPFRIHVLVVPKDDLLLPIPTVANATLFEDLSSFSFGSALQPVVDFDNTDPLTVPILARSSSSVIRRSTITGPASSPSIASGPSISVTGYGNPPDADQPPLPGQKQDIDTGDSRFGGNVILRDGILWAVHTVNVNGRAAIRFLKIDADTSALLQQTIIADSALAFYYPSIAVNIVGNVVISFSGSGSSQPVSVYAVGGLTAGGTTTLFSPVLIQSGFDDYERLDGSGRNRWGDYSATTLDPVDSSRFWTIQEFVITDDRWATKVTELILANEPPNDDCANATGVGSGELPFTTINATTDGLAASCDEGPAAQIDNDIWFAYTADCDGTATFSTCNNADFDTQVAVYADGACPPSTLLGCSNDAGGCGQTSSVDVEVLEDQVYLVRVGGAGGQSGNGTLSIVCTPFIPPANNACAAAQPVTDGITPFSTLGATTDGLPLVCDGQATPFQKDVWFSYSATCSGTTTISTCNDANFDTILAVYFPGPCPPSAPVACSNDADECGLTSRLDLELLEGLSYFIRVGGVNGATGSGSLSISCEVPCPWDCDGSDDGNVNVSDLLALLGQYDSDSPDNCTGGSCDYDGSGCVDVVDLLKLLAHYTTDPGGVGCP